jgi:uncharacterized damage-inducible protein DinB
MNANDVMKYGHLTVLRAVDGFTDENWNEGGVCGIWSTRQIIAHLASYELMLADVLLGIAEGGPTGFLDEYIAAGASFNDAQVEKRSGHTPAETLEEYRSAYERVAETALQIPEETWTKVGTILWYGDEYSLDDLIVYQFYGHKREHCSQIDVYRDRLAGASGSMMEAATT